MLELCGAFGDQNLVTKRALVIKKCSNPILTTRRYRTMIQHWQTMHDYHCFLNNIKTTFDSSERGRLHSELWLPWQKLRLLNTDKAMEFLLPFYSSTGRPATNQPQILRSFILFFLLLSMGLTPASLTHWVGRLKQDRLLAALIGCSTQSLPPLGSYYDFMDRLWIASGTDLYRRDRLLPASWNSRKPDRPKGKGQKAPESRPKMTEVLGKRLLNGKDILFNFEARLQQFFYAVAVLPSIQCGLIPSENLTVSGDGTAVHTHANPRGHRRNNSSSQEYDPAAPHHFSDPDATWGWDSDLDKYYYGYTLFQLSCYNQDLHVDLPLLLRFTSARRHDSVSFLVAFHECEKHMPALHIRDICLDSAMDNYPTYELMKDRHIRSFIDLNTNRGRPKSIPDSIQIDEDGTPICQAGLRMAPNGYDKSCGSFLWRCRFGKDHCSKCEVNCTSSKYGRVIKTKPDWDIRLYTDVPRGTDAYKKIYNQRTATERINNRILNDYGLHQLFIHRKEHYSFMATMIGICLHLDARYKQAQAGN